MQDAVKPARLFRFGVFEVDAGAGELRKQGIRIKLQEQPFQLLLMLLENRGEIVNRDEIRQKLWPPGTFVDFEQGIGTALKKLRQALCDDAEVPRYIETVPKRGYRFIFPAETDPARFKEPPVQSDHLALSGGYKNPAVIPGFPVRSLPWAITTACLAVAAALAFALLFRPVQPQPAPVQVSLLLPGSSGFYSNFAISPDGKRIVWRDRMPPYPQPQLWIRTFASGSTTPIPDSEDCSNPFWSPDSRFVACFTHTALMRFDAESGQTAVIAQAPYTETGSGDWGTDGNIIVGTNRKSPALYEVPAAGGAIRQIAAADSKRGEMSYSNPLFLPGDRKILLYIAGTGHTASGVYVMNLRTKAKKLVVAADAGPWYALGYVFYLRQVAIEAQAFDPESGTLSGKPVTVAQQVNCFPGGHTAKFAVSASGLLGFQSFDVAETHLAWFSRGGKELGTLAGEGGFYTPALSHDGSHVAVSLFANGRAATVWVYDVAKGSATQLTFSGYAIAPVWSSNDSRVVYGMFVPPYGIWSRAAGGLGPREKVITSRVLVMPTAISPDGAELAYMKFESTWPEIWLHSLANPRQPDHRLLPADINSGEAQFSPDGRWISFTSAGVRGQQEVYVVPYPNVSNRWQISSEGERNRAGAETAGKSSLSLPMAS